MTSRSWATPDYSLKDNWERLTTDKFQGAKLTGCYNKPYHDAYQDTLRRGHKCKDAMLDIAGNSWAKDRSFLMHERWGELASKGFISGCTNNDVEYHGIFNEIFEDARKDSFDAFRQKFGASYLMPTDATMMHCTDNGKLTFAIGNLVFTWYNDKGGIAGPEKKPEVDSFLTALATSKDGSTKVQVFNCSTIIRTKDGTEPEVINGNDPELTLTNVGAIACSDDASIV
jgi:hypothetical protein